MTAKAYLKDQIKKFQIEIREEERDLALIKCSWRCGGKRLIVWIDDEYNDFDENKPELKLLLALYSIEAYKESTDILGWTKEMGILDLSSELIEYYKSFGETIKYLESIDFPFEPPISYYDYHLGAGETKSLRRGCN